MQRSEDPVGPRTSGLQQNFARRVLGLQPGEEAPVALAFSAFFLILAGYFLVRPLRDEVGAADRPNLAWMFTGTFVVTLALVPIVGAAVTKLGRARYVPLVLHVVALTSLLFWFGLRFTGGDLRRGIAIALFIWISVFNLLLVTTFWGFLADLFRSQQGKRLFGLISAGGTTGALTGLFAADRLIELSWIGPAELLLVSVLLFEFAALVLVLLGRRCGVRADEQDDRQPQVTLRAALAGIRAFVDSPYLLGIGANVVLFTATATVIYFEQQTIVAGAIADPELRTQVFARLEFAAQGTTLILQLFLAGRLLRWYGIAACLATVPVLTMATFGLLAAGLSLWIVVAVAVLRRACHFALAKPAQEVLFTVVPREDKYKAKSFIDTFVYRASDATFGWVFELVRGFGAHVLVFTAALVPVTAAWALLCARLGRQHAKAAGDAPGAMPAGTPTPPDARPA